ncbi:MAG: SDR family oxidoreductase [Burkholderiales bacterium]|nr:SDR family oxidoreductase [Burkholderiales bacterium]
MSILITGASGFVGRALCSHLQSLQRLFFPLYRQAQAGQFAQARFLEALTADSDCRAQLQGAQVVVHLAARVHVMSDSESDPLAAYRASNTAATLNLARQAAQAGVKRFVFLSSIKVNGEQTLPGQPYSALSTPQPQDPYGVSKWEAEQALHALGLETGMEIVVIRPPLVYGPGVKANFLQLLRWVDKGVPLPLAGIHNARSMVYVGNLVDLIVRCCDAPQAVGQTFLVSDGVDVSSAELVRAIANALGKGPRVFYFPLPMLQLMAMLAGRAPALQRLSSSLQVDINATCTRLAWQPPYSMQQGLAATVKQLG